MKNKYTDTGRKNQKQQTRKKILETARQFLAAGSNYTLEDVAQKAQISRATIYRYYSNIDLLSAEAVLDLQTQQPETVYKNLKGNTLNAKLAEIQQYYNTLTLDNEAAFRKYLSIVVLHNAETPARGARRVEAIRMALAEKVVSLPKKEAELLVTAASALMGIEAIITAKDICGLNSTQAKEALGWALQMMLKGVLNEK